MNHEAFAVLPELIGSVGVTDPILIGHSDGASIALLNASQHPVGGLVLLAPHVFTEASGLRQIGDFEASIATTVDAVDTVGESRVY